MPLSPQDRAEIHDLYARYAYAFDRADAHAWAELFVPDGRFAPPGVDPVVGTDSLRAFVAERSSLTPGLRHTLSNVLVDGDGDEAAGSAYFVCYRIGDDGLLRMQNMGRYDDTFTRQAGSWRFATRNVASDLPVDLVGSAFAFTKETRP
jgi:ketosteroid isomerase-like protein